jgi:hypothetical protein
MEQNTMDIISRSGLEVELAAKEKEVSNNVSVAVSATSGRVSENTPHRHDRKVLSIRHDVVTGLNYFVFRGWSCWFTVVRRKLPTYAA